MEKFLKNNKGITLISLTVTIIVMLVLAAVTVRTIDGMNVINTMDMIEEEYDENVEQTGYKTQAIDNEWGSVIHKDGITPELYNGY